MRTLKLAKYSMRKIIVSVAYVGKLAFCYMSQGLLKYISVKSPQWYASFVNIFNAKQQQQTVYSCIINILAIFCFVLFYLLIFLFNVQVWIAAENQYRMAHKCKHLTAFLFWLFEQIRIKNCLKCCISKNYASATLHWMHLSVFIKLWIPNWFKIHK